MAYNVSALPAYVEQQNFPLIRAAVLEAKTATLVTKQAGVKGTSAINIVSDDDIWQPGACGFNPSGSTTFSQRSLVSGFIKVDKFWCPSDLDATYLQYQLKPGSYQEEIPFEQDFMAYQAKLIAKDIEVALWQGDKNSAVNNLSFIDGYLKNISGSAAYASSSFRQSGSTDAQYLAQSGSVAAALVGVYKAVPTQIKDAEDLVIFVGRETLVAYQSYLFGNNFFLYNGTAKNGEIELFPYGVRIVSVNGLNGVAGVPIVAGRLANFFYGVDLESDSTSFKMWWSEDNQRMQFTAKFRIAANVALPGEVVYWYNGL